MECCPTCGREEEGEKGGPLTLKKCSGCFTVSYCSTVCQKKHWKVHQEDCSPFKITHDPIFQKQLVATRDLKAGYLFLEEKPLLYFHNCFGYNCVCLTCGLDFKGTSPTLCSRCRWPICSSECEKNSTHAANECIVFSAQQIRYPEVLDSLFLFGKSLDPHFKIHNSNLVSGIIKILRGLALKKSDRKSYEKLMTDSYVAADNQFQDDRVIQNNLLVMFFLRVVNVQGLPVRVDEQEILDLLQVINCNNFEWNYDEESINRVPVQGVYLNSSRMNHSCTPNSHRTFLGFPHMVLKMRTATDVKKGQPLTIKYFSKNQFELLSRVERQNEVRTAWSFDCQCQRCLDSTELGTYMDGIACKHCRRSSEENNTDAGYFLPQNPLNFKDNSEWKCNRCKTSQKYRVIRAMVNGLGEDLKGAKILSAHDDKEYQILEKFIDNTCRKFLHPNHYIIQSASRDFIQLWTQPDFLMTRDYFEKAKERSEYLLSIQDTIAPGISFVRGFSLFKLCGLILETMKTISTEFTRQEVEDLLKTSIAHNEEASRFFGHDSTLFKPHQIYTEQLLRMRIVAEKVLQYLPKMTLAPNIAMVKSC